MKRIEVLFPLVVFVITGMLYGYTWTNNQNKESKIVMPDMKDWSEASQIAADAMMAKYGDPDEATDHMLIWHKNGPWKKSIVYSYDKEHNFPIDHKDVLEQFIYYRVPADKFDELAEFDGSVYARRTDGTISAKCDKEGANMLALNLAHEIITGAKTVKEARAFYARAIKDFVLDEEMSPYMKEFQFELTDGGTGQPDVNAVSKEDHIKIMSVMLDKKLEMQMEKKEMKEDK